MYYVTDWDGDGHTEITKGEPPIGYYMCLIGVYPTMEEAVNAAAKYEQGEE